MVLRINSLFIFYSCVSKWLTVGFILNSAGPLKASSTFVSVILSELLCFWTDQKWKENCKSFFVINVALKLILSGWRQVAAQKIIF